MNYRDKIRRNIRRANIKYLIIYTVFALIAGSGAYYFFTEGQSMKLLDLIPVPAPVSGAIFLILCAFLANLDAHTLAGILHERAFSKLMEDIKKFGKPEEVFSYVEQMPKSELCSQGDFRCDKKYVAFALSDLALIQPTRNLVWGYLQAPAKTSKRLTEQDLKNVRNVVLRFKNKDTLIVRTKSQENAEKLLAYVEECCPTMTSGYSYKLETVYKKNPENLRKHPDKRSEEKH